MAERLATATRMELAKARQRRTLTRLAAPIDGVVQPIHREAMGR